MILELDLGNTRCKWRLRQGQDIIARDAFVISNSFDPIAKPINSFQRFVKQVWVASVVGPEIEGLLSTWCISFFGVNPQFARSAKQCLNVINGYDNPSSLGVDRWLSIIACNQRFRTGCVIVSMGTAVTVDLVSKQGVHAGGFIAPGLNLMLDSLQQKTSRVRFESRLLTPDSGPGFSTAAGIYGAITAMFSGLIDNGMRQMNLRCPDEKPELIFAGGDAQTFLSLYPQARFMQDLVLDGLAYIFNESRSME